MTALVEAVKAHATEHYAAGWDVVIETMTDEEIAERIGRATTVKGALAKLTDLVDAQIDRRIEALSQSGEHDAEVAALVEASKTGRGRSKTGHPKADRAIAGAKVEKAHAAAQEHDRATSDTRAAAVAKKAAAKKAAAKPARVLKPVTATIQAEVPAGYVARYTHKSYDLYSTVPGAGKIQWLVVCNTHGNHTAATGGREGDVLGSKAGRSGWCTGCKDGQGEARSA